jgi:hypothetical protein
MLPDDGNACLGIEPLATGGFGEPVCAFTREQAVRRFRHVPCDADRILEVSETSDRAEVSARIHHGGVHLDRKAVETQHRAMSSIETAIVLKNDHRVDGRIDHFMITFEGCQRRLSRRRTTVGVGAAAAGPAMHCYVYPCH